MARQFIMARCPIGRHIESEHVPNVLSTLTMLSSIFREPKDEIEKRLQSGERLKSPAYEYWMIRVN